MTGLVADKKEIKAKELQNRDEKDKLWDSLVNSMRKGDMLGCSAKGNGMKKYNGQDCGILSGHAYAIMDAIELPWKEDEKDKKKTYHPTHRLLRLKNPWGSGEWTQKWSEKEGYINILEKFMPEIKQHYVHQ